MGGLDPVSGQKQDHVRDQGQTGKSQLAKGSDFSQLAQHFCDLQVAKSRTQTLLKKPSVSKDQYVDNVLTW